jgi:hypothetical protein
MSQMLIARPPSGGRLDHAVQSLRTRLQHLQHTIDEHEAAAMRRPNQPLGQLTVVPKSPRINEPRLSEVVRERREQQKRAVDAARQELSEARRDSALSQRYDKRIMTCQRLINKQENLTEVRQTRQHWRDEKQQRVTQRHDAASERTSSARSQRYATQTCLSERDARMLRERRFLEDELHRLQHNLNQQKSQSRDRDEGNAVGIV